MAGTRTGFLRSKPDYQYWLSMACWSLGEASHLLCDCEPDFEEDALGQKDIKFPDVYRTHEIVYRAFMTGELKRLTNPPPYDLWVEPREFLKWANEKRLSIPEGLRKEFKKDNPEVPQMSERVTEVEQTNKLILQYGIAAERLYSSMVSRLKVENKTLTHAKKTDLRTAALSEFDASPETFVPLTRTLIEGDALYIPAEKQKRQMIGMIIKYALSHLPDVELSYQKYYKRFLDLKSPK